MRLGEYQFRFRAVPTLLLALPVPLFVALGLWQLDRAEQKREWSATLAERVQQPPVRLSGPVADPGALRWRPVQARGWFEPEQQIFLENRTQGGRPGVQVVTPLRLEGSDYRVLVNRGWLALDQQGELPAVATPEGLVEVSGAVDSPSPPALALDQGSAAGWGRRWPYLTLELFRGTVAYPLVPLLSLQSPADPHGFGRAWPRDVPKEGMHLGYALQWFAFALIALVIYGRLSLERIDLEVNRP